jgi:hypothetical protein
MLQLNLSMLSAFDPLKVFSSYSAGYFSLRYFALGFRLILFSKNKGFEHPKRKN